jgi:hypothetical protein
MPFILYSLSYTGRTNQIYLRSFIEHGTKAELLELCGFSLSAGEDCIIWVLFIGVKVN